jgi:sulfatase modifying factor 1
MGVCGTSRNTGAKTYATDLGSIAWYNKNSGNKTHPVGKKKPNAFGLYDMIGNVYEWVEDWYDADYYATSETEDPQGSPNGEFRVLRGGSWLYNAIAYRVSYRNNFDPASRTYNDGFRLVAPQQ